MSLFGDIVSPFKSAFHAATHFVSHAWHAATHFVSNAWNTATHLASGVFDWVGHHWKQIAVIGAAVVAGTIVTIATGGLGAPLVVALTAGGFVGGATGSVVQSLLNGKSPNLLSVLKAGVISGVISAGTFGLGKLAAPIVSRILAPAATRAIASASEALPGATTTPEAAGSTLAALDPATQRVLAQYGLTPETSLYRVTNPRYVDFTRGEIAGNPNSAAVIQDPYAPKIELPESVAFRAQHPELPPILVPQSRLASDLGPTLNVATTDPSGYAAPGAVKVELSLSDVLANGGRIYRDTSATLNDAYIITVPETVPVRAITAPTGASAEGLPLSFTRSTTETKVEAYVRNALRAGASAGRAVTTGPAAEPTHPAPPPTSEGFVQRISGSNP